MADTLRHRGPDGEGIWHADGVALAHRRLAILDLTDCAAQPMRLGAQVLTYNGEIYNHEQLRERLPGPFTSTGDTETLLHLLARKGAGCLDMLVGMFAFAHWDESQRRLLLVRDRLGIKPLYYRELHDGFAFASELKALLPLGAAQIDRSALRDFLFYGYVPAPKTIYAGIRKLPAGHTLTYQHGKIRIARYWNPTTEIEAGSAEDWRERLDSLLRNAIPAHLLADVPVGVFLSGGIDSALVASYLPAPRTFTLGFEDESRSELEAARALAAHFGTSHDELSTHAGDLELALDTLLPIFDEPFGDSAAWSNYLIARRARETVKVALSGEGGDEIFCGYPRYWSRIGARSGIVNRFLARNLPPLSRWGHSMQKRAAVELEAYGAALGGMPAAQVDALLAPDWREPDYDYAWFYRQFWKEELSPLARLRWLDLNTSLAEGLLTKVDRTSMAVSLEVRPPLVDHRVVELMLRADPQILVDEEKGRGKLLARGILEPRVPRGFLQRPKMGFGLPVHRWISRSPQIIANASRRLVQDGVLRAAITPQFRRAWAVLVLERWFARYV